SGRGPRVRRGATAGRRARRLAPHVPHHRGGARRAGPRLVHVRGRRRDGHRAARARRLRGLPAALRGRDLPVQPDLRRLEGRQPGGHRPGRRLDGGRARPGAQRPLRPVRRPGGQVAGRRRRDPRRRPGRPHHHPAHHHPLDEHGSYAMTSTTTDSPLTTELRDAARAALQRLGAGVPEGTGLPVVSPLSGRPLLELRRDGAAETEAAVGRAAEAFRTWRSVPAPVRGQVVKRLGELLTEHKADLAELVTLEAGKITSEALGEVQEMIDICDYAVGLSRQVGGRTMPSERPGHRLMETWHPLGVVGVVSAFNFPVAVWSWNTAVALVCGDTVVWKPSEKTLLSSLGASALLDQALAEAGFPAGVSQLVLGD